MVVSSPEIHQHQSQQETTWQGVFIVSPAWGLKELDTTEHAHAHMLIKCQPLSQSFHSQNP